MNIQFGFANHEEFQRNAAVVVGAAIIGGLLGAGVGVLPVLASAVTVSLAGLV